MTYLPGTLFLVDTSAAARQGNDKVAQALESIIDDGLVATCVTLDLEAAYSARTAGAVRNIFNNRREHLIQLPLNEQICERAKEIMLLLAGRGLHRAAGPLDILTAAVAEYHRATVTHYDADFDYISQVTGVNTQWIVPRGSVD